MADHDVSNEFPIHCLAEDSNYSMNGGSSFFQKAFIYPNIKSGRGNGRGGDVSSVCKGLPSFLQGEQGMQLIRCGMFLRFLKSSGEKMTDEGSAVCYAVYHLSYLTPLLLILPTHYLILLLS